MRTADPPPTALGVSLRAVRAAALGAAPDVIAWRRAFHAWPEIAYQEHETAATVAAALSRMGVEVSTGVGGTTGVVGVLRGGRRVDSAAGRPGGLPVVAIRADMDALPIDGEDPKEVPYRARVAGARHVCGHDAHTAMALGVARVLAEVRDGWSGTIKFLFEPAEECLGTALTPGA